MVNKTRNVKDMDAGEVISITSNAFNKVMSGLDKEDGALVQTFMQALLRYGGRLSFQRGFAVGIMAGVGIAVAVTLFYGGA